MGMDEQAKTNMEQAMAVAAKPAAPQGAAGAGPKVRSRRDSRAYAMERSMGRGGGVGAAACAGHA